MMTCSCNHPTQTIGHSPFTKKVNYCVMNTECGEDGTGKALLRNGDKVVEIDTDDVYGRDLIREFLGLYAAKTEMQTKISPTAIPSRKTRSRHFDPDQEELVCHTTGESSAKKEAPGDYRIYLNPRTGRLTGVLTTSTNTVRVLLGSPHDPNSKISLTKQAVLSMPYFEAFTRRQLSSSLPKGMTKSGEVMKFCLDYLEKVAGLVVKEREGNAFVFKRIKEGRDAPAAQSGEDGAKAIPR